MASSSAKMRVLLLASEWGSKYGGISTLNRELAIQLAKHPDVQVFVFLPRCDQEEKKAALRNDITLVQATRRPGFSDETHWLCFPPDDLEFDFVIGHGVVLGRQAQIIRERYSCKWIQFVHTDPEEMGMFKDYPDAISKGVEKRRAEVELCVMADCVVTVGPKLAENYRIYLRYCEKDQTVHVLTPGIFSEFSNVKHGIQDERKCGVLAFGRSDAEDFPLKGFDIAAKAVAKLDYAHLIFVGAYDKQEVDVANNLKRCDVPSSRLKVRSFMESREDLKHLFSEADLVIMPSRTEGYGLAALEALSAGLPVLVSANSGFGQALGTVPFGGGCVIGPDDAEVWAKEIDKVWAKDRGTRLQESKALRDNYALKYNWEEQCRDLVQKMRTIRNVPVPVSKLKRTTPCSSTNDPNDSTTAHYADSTAPNSKQTTTMTSQKLGIKDGQVDDDDLEELSGKVGKSWEYLARRLKFKKAEITAFRKDNEEYAKKALSMLETWKEKYGSEATYRVLYEALCHRFVNRKDLAEMFCTL